MDINKIKKEYEGFIGKQLGSDDQDDWDKVIYIDFEGLWSWIKQKLIANQLESQVVPNEVLAGEQYTLLIDALRDLIYNDSHRWSKRPCQTCRAITSIIKKPFGCYQKMEEK